MTPGTTITVQLTPGAKEAVHVVDKVVPDGIGIAEGHTLVAAFVPVLVIVMIRGVPVRLGNVPAPFTLRASQETLDASVVFTTLTARVTGVEVIEPRAAPICVLPGLTAATKPLLPEALLMVAVPGVPDVQVTVAVMS
jgi:hypothetical protein